MAGEQVYRHSLSATSIDYTASEAGKRGDIVDVGGRLAFLLDDVAKGGRVAAAVECDLVYISQPAQALAWMAGEPVGWHGDEAVKGRSYHDHSIGIVHHDTPATEKLIPLIWRSGAAPPGYSYYQMLNPQTTPAFTLTSITRNAEIPDTDAGLQYRLCRTTTLGIRPGVPIVVDYEGDLLWTRNRPTRPPQANMEVSIGYQLWRDDAAKRATIWRRSFRDSQAEREIGISMDSFSNQSILDIGTMIPNDKSTPFIAGVDGAPDTPAVTQFTEVTAADFEKGINVDILLRFRVFTPGNLEHRLKGGRVNPVHLLHPQIVTSQIGGRIQ